MIHDVVVAVDVDVDVAVVVVVVVVVAALVVVVAAAVVVLVSGCEDVFFNPRPTGDGESTPHWGNLRVFGTSSCHKDIVTSDYMCIISIHPGRFHMEPTAITHEKKGT